MRVLLSDRRRLLFFLSNVVSAMGDDALLLALAVWVRELTGSTAYAAVDMSAVSVASLLAPLTGVVVDRVRRKRLLLTVYAATALLLLALLPVHRGTQVWLVIGVTFLYGLSGTLTSGGQVALMKTLVPDELLADANGLEQALYQGARLITPALGVGMLAKFGAPAVLAADIATFVIAIALLALVRVREPRAPRQPGRSRQQDPARRRAAAGEPGGRSRFRTWSGETAAGFRFLAASPVLRATTLAEAVGFLVFGLFVPFGLQVTIVGLHHAPSFLAVFITVQSVFGVVGAAVAGPIARRVGAARLMSLGLAAFALSCPLFAIASTPVVLGGLAILGCSVPWFLIGSSTVMQQATPLDLVGRVSGANSLAVMTPQASGNLLGAALVPVLSYRLLALLFALALAATTAYLASRPALRRKRDGGPLPAAAA